MVNKGPLRVARKEAGMRRLAWLALTGSLAAMAPALAMAQDAVIRIEAKRGEAAATEAATVWAQQFDDVVTFPAGGGWFAIGLGPQPREDADARLVGLKAEGRVPADSFVAVADRRVVLSPLAGSAPDGASPEPVAQPEPEPEAPAGSHIRLQTVATRAEGDAALATWRETFPEAGLWQLPGGRFAVSLGPLDEAGATAWLAAFREAGLVPADAFTAPAADLGEVADAGSPPELPAPGAAEPMPPLDEVQRALRWSGRYNGEIDGRSGPQTSAAIAAEVAASRLSPDPGTAMRLLIESRETWRAGTGLAPLEDAFTGITLSAPLEQVQFDRNERALSIYGPKDGSGVAVILFSQPGGQQELLDMTGLVTALGWVPSPERRISQGHALLQGANADHIGRAEGWVRDGRVEGFVLIWPVSDRENQPRMASEMSDSFARFAPAENDPAAE